MYSSQYVPVKVNAFHVWGFEFDWTKQYFWLSILIKVLMSFWTHYFHNWIFFIVLVWLNDQTCTNSIGNQRRFFTFSTCKCWKIDIIKTYLNCTLSIVECKYWFHWQIIQFHFFQRCQIKLLLLDFVRSLKHVELTWLFLDGNP